MDYIYKTLDLDPPDPDRDRFEEFIKNSKYVISLLYHREYNPIITKRGFTEKLTKHPEDGNMEYLTGIITQNNGSKNLVIAPTGSGKTYSIDAIFKQLNPMINSFCVCSVQTECKISRMSPVMIIPLRL